MTITIADIASVILAIATTSSLIYIARQRMAGGGERDKAFRDRVYQLRKDTRSAEHPFRISE